MWKHLKAFVTRVYVVAPLTGVLGARKEMRAYTIPFAKKTERNASGIAVSAGAMITSRNLLPLQVQARLHHRSRFHDISRPMFLKYWLHLIKQILQSKKKQTTNNHQVYHNGNASDNICYQTNYTDANYVSKGYVTGFCPFQLVDSVEVDTICNGHSEENLKFCPDSQINITIYKMGKSM